MFDEYYDVDIYEPTLADEILTEASAKLMDAIKQDVAKRIKEIEQANERLSRENKILHEQVIAASQEKRDLQRQREELERKAARMSVEDFLGQRAVLMYSVGREYVKGPKCDRCNDERKLPYKTPLGADATEGCPCGVSTIFYTPKEFVITEMGKDRCGRNVRAWFKQYNEEDHYSSSEFVKDEDVYNGEDDFSSLDRHKVFFQDKSQCQAYCDYLNQEEV
jgi:hypothetical protein